MNNTDPNYVEAAAVIWAPDDYPLEVVAGAAEVVLSRRGALSSDVHQAAYLITTMRPH